MDIKNLSLPQEANQYFDLIQNHAFPNITKTMVTDVPKLLYIRCDFWKWRGMIMCHGKVAWHGCICLPWDFGLGPRRNVVVLGDVRRLWCACELCFHVQVLAMEQAFNLLHYPTSLTLEYASVYVLYDPLPTSWYSHSDISKFNS